MTENKSLNPDESEHHSCEHCGGCKKKTFDNEKPITLESIFINGTLMNENVAREIANARNIISVVSIEGTLDTLPRLKFVGFCDQR